MNLTWQILKDCEVASPTNLKWNTPIARFPVVILRFPSSDIGFPMFWQRWIEKVLQDAEEEVDVN